MRPQERPFVVCVFAAAILLSNGRAFLRSVAGADQPRPGGYDESYINTHKGKVHIEIPEVFELANIAIALTDYGLEKPYAVRKKGGYYKRVMNHFRAHKDHPLISTIEFAKDNSFSRYYGFRENSARYRFDDDRIVLSGTYPQSWAWSRDVFTEHVDLVQDFARKTRFREFYKDNRAFYRERIETCTKRIPVKKMWEWLESQFPQRYDSYKVIFSPLIGGSHSTQRCEGNGFKEAVMFVSGPALHSDRPAEVREGLLSRVVFTEIDHNYVNPTTWLHWFGVWRAFSPPAHWNEQRGYRSAMQTFNEYMTWGVFLLYADDVYEESAFEEIRRVTVDIMEERRKFTRFGEFSDRLLALYRNRKPAQKVPDLYPAILAWAGKERRTAQ